MGTCFVIQPFDNGEFDKRYDDVFVHAIKNAGLDPYRVDRDPSVRIPIDTIEDKIKSASLCLADITLSNPNVWYEVGYAFASNKDVVLVCSEKVPQFPFDIQHRQIIKYSQGAPRDFEHLKEKITQQISAFLINEKTIANLSKSPIKKTEGLSQHEIIALASIMQNRNSPKDSVTSNSIHQDMERAGSNKLASNLAITMLLKKSMIQLVEEADYNGNYYAYLLTDKGEKWLLNNVNYLSLNQEKKQDKPVTDDAPF